jgi:hypothetical protein
MDQFAAVRVSKKASPMSRTTPRNAETGAGFKVEGRLPYSCKILIHRVEIQCRLNGIACIREWIWGQYWFVYENTDSVIKSLLEDTIDIIPYRDLNGGRRWLTKKFMKYSGWT